MLDGGLVGVLLHDTSELESCIRVGQIMCKKWVNNLWKATSSTSEGNLSMHRTIGARMRGTWVYLSINTNAFGTSRSPKSQQIGG